LVVLFPLTTQNLYGIDKAHTLKTSTDVKIVTGKYL
jgi:hypothetical protein